MTPATPVLPPAFAPDAAYYAAIAAAPQAAIALQAPYDKRRKETHRYTIADTRGPLRLTIPVRPPHGIPRARWSDTLVSGHGRWQAVHSTTLASAYGRTPFYEHYIDRLAPLIFPDEGTPLSEAIKALNTAICRILLIDTPIDYTSDRPSAPMPEADPSFSHWQIRRHTHGFIPALSILDLIFNTGPEAPLLLRTINKQNLNKVIFG